MKPTLSLLSLLLLTSCQMGTDAVRPIYTWSKCYKVIDGDYHSEYIVKDTETRHERAESIHGNCNLRLEGHRGTHNVCASISCFPKP